MYNLYFTIGFATGSNFHDTDKNRSFASKAPVFHLANTDK